MEWLGLGMSLGDACDIVDLIWANGHVVNVIDHSGHISSMSIAHKHPLCVCAAAGMGNTQATADWDSTDSFFLGSAEPKLNTS